MAFHQTTQLFKTAGIYFLWSEYEKIKCSCLFLGKLSWSVSFGYVRLWNVLWLWSVHRPLPGVPRVCLCRYLLYKAQVSLRCFCEGLIVQQKCLSVSRRKHLPWQVCEALYRGSYYKEAWDLAWLVRWPWVFNPLKYFHWLSVIWKYWSFLPWASHNILKIISKMPSMERFHSKNNIVYIQVVASVLAVFLFYKKTQKFP